MPRKKKAEGFRLIGEKPPRYRRGRPSQKGEALRLLLFLLLLASLRA